MRPPLADGLEPGGRHAEWEPATPAYVVADVDGTLVGPQPHATDEVVQAIADAQADGLDVGFATGRMRLAMTPLADQLQMNGPHILHNGAEVRHGGHTIHSWPLPRQQQAAVLEISDRLDAYVEFYVPQGFVVAHRREDARAHWALLGHEPLREVHRVADIDGEVLKVTFAVFDDTAEMIIAAVEEAGLRAGPSGSPLTPGITYVNATHPDADKGAALRVAAQYCRLDLAAVVAIGDAPNDLSMLATAGTAVAMGQAPDAVKQAAHVVVPDVDEHGVAHALRACLRWRS